MIIKNKHIISRKKKIITIVCIGLLFASAGYVIFLRLNSPLTNQEMTDQVDRTSAVQEKQVPGIADTPAQNNNSELPTKSSDNSATNDELNADTPASEPEKPNITRAEQVGENIKAAALFQKSSPGYCSLRLSQSGQQDITANASIVVGPSYYICTFTIPRAALSSTGQWNATIIHQVGSASTKSDTKIIEIK